MAAAIQNVLPSVEVALVPGGRGDFVVTAGSTALWNKRLMNDEFPDNQDIIEAVKRLAEG